MSIPEGLWYCIKIGENCALIKARTKLAFEPTARCQNVETGRQFFHIFKEPQTKSYCSNEIKHINTV